MSKSLWGTGSGLMLVSLFSAVLLSAVDPAWAGEHLTLLVVWGWAQQAALVLGAALIAAGSVVARLAPPPVGQRAANSEPSSDWFA